MEIKVTQASIENQRENPVVTTPGVISQFQAIKYSLTFIIKVIEAIKVTQASIDHQKEILVVTTPGAIS